MRIAVIGAGGVGGYFGARLAAAGEDVVFVQRGAHLRAMQESGLELTSALGDVRLGKVQAVADARGVAPVDMVLVTVKSNDTEAAAGMVLALLKPDTGVVSLQNGVENEARLAAIMGSERVLGGVAYILSLIEKPGCIAHKGPFARLQFGEMDGRRSPRAEALLAACRRAGIDAEIPGDVTSAIWTKFVGLCPHNGMTALTRLAIGPIRDDPDCRDLLVRAAFEVIAVAKARGVCLAEAVTRDPMRVFAAAPADMTSSMHHDLTHGKPLELDWLNGAVVRLGRAAGVATPVNGFIYAALKLHRHGQG